MQFLRMAGRIAVFVAGSLSAWSLFSYVFKGPASITVQSLLMVLPGAVAASVVMLLIPKRRNERTLTPPTYRGD